MNIFPFQKIVLTSKLNENELTSRLNEYVEPFQFKLYWLRDSPKPYVGNITEKGFGIRRIFKGRNSFIPFVIGKIEKKEAGSKIVVIMRLHFIVMFPLLFLTCFVFFYGVIRENNFVLLFFILVFYIVLMYFFNIETNRTKKDLSIFLEAGVESKY